MDRAGLRALQETLKARYREDPDAALVTLSRQGILAEGLTCSVSTARAVAEVGLTPPPAATAARSARATCSSRRWRRALA